ncbi:hypothetical protein [Kitasatospora aureofaciens]|uniref:hypothetical protein n=1 Tax=Kitasatospora aureofaciens TaxID=1894 RepID=UPI0033EB7DF8
MATPYGFARTADYKWAGLVSMVPGVDLTEHDTRTFALCEVMVQPGHPARQWPCA